MSKFIKAWYLIYTRPQQENKVADGLTEMQINYLLPKANVLRQWHDRKKIIHAPLFPSYIFVQINSLANYYSCIEIDGFCFFVKFSNRLAVIPQKTINDIDLLVRKGNNIEVSSESFQPGQIMTISQGPLCGLTCEVVEVNKKQKVCVRVKFLNRIILADVPAQILTATVNRG